MNIKIVDGIEPAKELSDTVVIIDVFRASNTILAALSQGVKEIYVVSDEDEATHLQKKHPASLYFGEHMGDKLPDADYTNSPSQICGLDLDSKTIILQTTMGSKAIVASSNAKEILVASFGNVTAVAEYLRKSQPNGLNFVACGEVSDVRALEDYECAKYISSLVQGEQFDFSGVRDTILNHSNGAKRLKDKGQRGDLEFCLNLDYSEIVPYAGVHKRDVIVRAK